MCGRHGEHNKLIICHNRFSCILRTNIQLGESNRARLRNMDSPDWQRSHFQPDSVNTRSIQIPPYGNIRMRLSCFHDGGYNCLLNNT